MKPNVFIMSSNAGHGIAEAYASVLSRNGRMDVRTWKSGDFHIGDPFVDTLRRSIIQYDFGINVLTPDDITSVRGEAKVEPRDNVLFELGMFLGARGRLRAFPLTVTVAGVAPSIPTDLLGVKNNSLSLERLDLGHDEMISRVERDATEMASRMLELFSRPEITILPSTGLAIGYFYNFILPVMKGLRASRQAIVTVAAARQTITINLDTTKLMICIPEELRHATRENWSLQGEKLRLGHGEVVPSNDPELPRAYPFRIDADFSDGKLTIYDTPTTLLTAQYVVRRLLPDGSYGRADRAISETREMHNFETTIRALLDEPDHNWFAPKVSFVPWSQL